MRSWACASVPRPRLVRILDQRARVRLVAVVMIFAYGFGGAAWRNSCALANGELDVSTASDFSPVNGKTVGAAASEIIELRIGEPLNQEISRGETQSFLAAAGEGQYVKVVFEWQGIDLTVAVVDPAGQRLPATVLVLQPGPVSVAFVAAEPGPYRLEVGTTVKEKVSGGYQVKLDQLRLPTPADLNLIAAQNLLAEGRGETTAQRKIEKYNQALALWQSAQDVDGEAQTLMLLGDVYRSVPNLENAKASYEQAATKWNAQGYLRGVAYAKMALGAVSRMLGSAEVAQAYYREAQTLFVQSGDRRGEASALYGQGFAAIAMGRITQALEFMNSSLTIRQAIGDRLGQVNAMNVMADAHRVLGDPEQSLSRYAQAAGIAEEIEAHLLRASIINGIAAVDDDRGEWQKASEGYRRALNEYNSLLSPDLTICSSNPPPERIETCRLVASTIDNLGETYNSLGEPQLAKAEFERSMAIREKLKQPRGQGSTEFHLGYAYFLLGDMTGALEHYQSALNYQETARDEKGKAITFTYRGMLQLALNDPTSALTDFDRALPALQASGDKRGEAIARDKLGVAYGLLGKSTESATAFAQAIDLWRLAKDPDGEALTFYNKANAERSAGDLKAASEHAETAIKLVESLRQRVSSARFRTSYLARNEDYYVLNIDLKMQLFKASGDVSYAAAAFESSEKARARVLLDLLNEARLGRTEIENVPGQNQHNVYEQRDELLRKLVSKTQARTKLLSSPHSPEQIALIDQEIAVAGEKLDLLDEQIRQKNPRYLALTKPRPSSLKQIQSELDDDTLLLEYALGEKRSYVWLVSRGSIQGFELRGREEIEAAAQRVTRAVTARNLEHLFESPTMMQLRWDEADQDFPEAAAALSKLVLDPVAAQLGRKRVVIVADGALQLIPFVALPASAGFPTAESSRQSLPIAAAVAAGPMLLKTDYGIISLPSASVLALQRRELANRKPARLAVAVIADPVFDKQDERVVRAIGNQHRKALADRTPPQSKQTVPSEPSNSGATDEHSALASALRDVGMDPEGKLHRLPLSFQEARGILRAAPATGSFSALDFKANRATAMSAELSKYRIIHFATHGVMDLEHPELSGMVLSMVDEKGQSIDGYLRLNEIYNLNLPAELVVLSACQTGVGKQVKGEGLIALTRGFMYAGARSVVASLWKVDDLATSALMAEFYRQMFTNHLKPAAALHAAQREIASQKRWQSPYYWAGFFLQGDWN